MTVNVWKVIRLPFDTLRNGYRELRKALFTAERPEGRYLVVGTDVAATEAALADAGVDYEGVELTEPFP